MHQLLIITSLLIYTTLSQQCSNDHSQSTLFAISINGQHVNKIGITEYLSIIDQAANAVLPPSTNGNVAVATFGGVVDGATDETLLSGDFVSGDYTTISATITGLESNADFNQNFGNAVSASLTSAIALSWVGQKYNILFVAGNPLANGKGTSTNPEDLDSPCGKGITAKQNNIQTYVVLIGEQGIDFVKEFYACLVEDKANDLIIIDPTSPATGIANLKARVCKTNGIDIKITEVNPISGIYKPFIEVLNRGKDTAISVCFTDTTTCTAPGVDTVTGAYYVGYDSSGTGAPLTLPTETADLTDVNSGGWTAIARADGTEEDSVTHGSTFQDQVTSPAPRSFALRADGFYNQYGANWRMSCGDTGGTPGQTALDTCATSGGTCTDNAQCTADGDGGGSCDGSTNFCGCGSTYFSDADTCIDIPTPNVTGCTGYVVYDSTKKEDFTYFTWDMAYDGFAEFTLEYMKEGPSSQQITIGMAYAAAALQLQTSDINAGSTNIALLTTINSPTSPAERTVPDNSVKSVVCNIGTLNPTLSPTNNPSESPAQSPTGIPTPSPTFDRPGVYISNLGGVCGTDRCNCFGEVRGCCIPYGPDIDPITYTTGFEPADGCVDVFKSIEVTKDQQKGSTSEITIGKYGDTEETTVFYTMVAYGQINSSMFNAANLSLWAPAYLNRSMDTPAPVTPSPLSTTNNQLNIEIQPPGDLPRFRGNVTIPSGETSIPLSIYVLPRTLKCDKNTICTTYSECQETAMAFQLMITNCSSPASTQDCAPIYPTMLWVSVTRSEELCNIVFGIGSKEDELPDWFWWVLIALIIFLLILAWLVYRFWWKQKKTAGELGDAEDELDQQQADNEQGFGKDLDVGDVAFNPMATGVPGMNRPADAFGNELHQRQLEQQNDMVDVQAEVFQVRQDYGQVATGPRHQH